MAYRIEFSRPADRQFRDLPRSVQVRLTSRIDGLSEDARPSGAVRLAGGGNLYRLRVGDYRVVYAVEDDRLVVLIVRAGHRRDVYRRLLG